MRPATDRGPAGWPLRALFLASVLAFPAAAQDVVTFARPVEQATGVVGNLVSVGGDVTLRAPVSRDLIVIGGNALLAPGARVNGDVLVLGGVLRAGNGGPRSFVGGEVHTVAAAEAAFLAEVETSPAAATLAPARLLLSLRVALLAFWLVVGAALLRLAPRRLAAAAETLPAATALDALLGAVALLSGALLSAFLLAAIPSALALAGMTAVLAALLAAKAFGLAVLFLRIGRRLAAGHRRGTALWGDPAALAVGLLALGLVSLVPVVGRIAWMAASLLAIGVSLATGFGRPKGVESRDLTLSARRA